ncbi:MAG: YbaK/EbsC family protein [Deltaproteobacteria bacterium]|nr:YbaK/EbsC family protein [Deltaproteobacteria bacterium]MBW2136840.1 YbaK/EbsC family protein [Deltaproteobacteria bacterium]
MSRELSKKAQVVQEALREFGLSCEVVQLPDSTRTAKEAAQAIGCSVDQIAKSIVFKGIQTGRPYLVVARGTKRVDERKLEAIVREPVEKADADFVRRETGFAIGGVPPLGHTKKIDTFIDEGLSQHESLWAAAGTPHAVFKLTPEDLSRITSGLIVKIS